MYAQVVRVCLGWVYLTAWPDHVWDQQEPGCADTPKMHASTEMDCCGALILLLPVYIQQRTTSQAALQAP